jgi:O-6-methylguanine DNA methyltransferase
MTSTRCARARNRTLVAAGVRHFRRHGGITDGSRPKPSDASRRGPAKLKVMLEWSRFEAAGYTLGVVASEAGIRAIELRPGDELPGRECGSNPFLQQAIAQLRAYFAGELRDFDLTLDMHGTGFQKRVWEELLNIPYGETRSYSFVATHIGAPKAVRAVGAANGRNPIPIVVPCHRVIGAGGSLVGYGGGLPLKSFLLDLEARHSHLFQ